MTKPLVFLDRDGVIIQNHPRYIRSIEHVEFIPGSIEAIKMLNDAGAWVVVITNQAGIGHGIVSKNIAARINYHIRMKLEEGGAHIDALFMCPHTPADKCACRKPHTQLVRNAYKHLQYDMLYGSNRYFIGDQVSDLMVTATLPALQPVLVKTGLGEKALKSLPIYLQVTPLLVYNDLKEAAVELVKKFEE